MSRVLIIEDDDNNMELISFILEHNGYETIKARTGQEGFALAGGEIVDGENLVTKRQPVLDQVRQ